MDPITHGFAGVVVRNLGFARRYSLLILVLFSVLPDIDFATRLWGDSFFLRHHRGIIHGLPALAAVTVSVFVLIGRKRGGLYYSALAFIGYGFHIFLDLTNQYGVRLFAPLDYQMYSLDLTFIIDPYVSVGLILSALIASLKKDGKRVVALSTVCLLLAYIGIRQHFRGMTTEFLRSTEKEYVVRRVCPLPNDFLRWWFVADSGDEIKVGFADLFTRRVYLHKSYPLPHSDDPAIEKSVKAEMTQSFLYFARQPYPEVERNGKETVVVWRDLSYAYSPRDHFVTRIVMDGKDRIVRTEFRL